jgi:two-component system LytT family response regulator
VWEWMTFISTPQQPLNNITLKTNMQRIYKCLIADDSPIDRDVVEMYVSKIETLEIEALCSNGLEAATVLQQTEIDIVFSDIDMPDLSGIGLKQSLQKPPVFIFISSYAEHAAESYNLDVIDFIVKPVSLARLMKATSKAIEYIELKNKNKERNKTNILSEEIVPPNTTDSFFIKENNEYIKINNFDVIFIESMGGYSKFFTTSNKKHIALVSLKNIEEQLTSPNFIRIHKQYIINSQHIISLSADGEILLTNDNKVAIGQAYKAGLMEVINKKVLLR